MATPHDSSEPTRSGTSPGFETSRTQVVKLAARREHCFHSLLELTRQLSPDLDVATIADRVLFNLLGQLCTSRAALWLMDSARPNELSLVRCHGFRGGAEAWGTPPLDAAAFARLVESRSPMHVPQAEVEPVRALAARDVCLVAPMFAGDRPIGLLALGPRVAGEYGPVDVEVLEVAVGVAGTFLENSRLHAQQRKLNAQLQRQNTMLVQMEQLRSEFVANTNHELRTPLTVIQAALQCVQDFGLKSAHAPVLLDSAMSQTKRLSQLVEKLLTYADMRGGRVEIPCVPGDVGALLREFFTHRQGPLLDGAHPGTLTLEAAMPQVMFHTEHLTRVLDELMDNALKFTPRGTQVQLRARALTNQDGHWVAVELADEGPGIPPADLERLFQSFVQGDGSSTRKVGGLGIGLALARQLVDGMGGRLEVESAVGRGTTFRLVLPIAREATAEAEAA